MQQHAEEDTLKRLGDPATQRAAFTFIVNRYSERLYWHIRKMVLNHDDANDILQNVFMKAWTGIDGFRGDSKISTWLYKIAVNECISFLNKQRQLNSVPLDDADSYLLQTMKADEYFDGDELDIKFQKAILKLPDKQRQVFVMKYQDNLKYEQMSEIFGTSTGALKASYHHAVKKIQELLTNDV